MIPCRLQAGVQHKYRFYWHNMCLNWVHQMAQKLPLWLEQSCQCLFASGGQKWWFNCDLPWLGSIRKKKITSNKHKEWINVPKIQHENILKAMMKKAFQWLLVQVWIAYSSRNPIWQKNIPCPHDPQNRYIYLYMKTKQRINNSTSILWNVECLNIFGNNKPPTTSIHQW